jgi:ribosomal protein S1
VVSVNEEKRSLVFSEKDASWSMYSTQIEVGSVYDGLVASVADYGAFVHILFPDGIISSLSSFYNIFTMNFF